jgi:hypothetical protein
MKSLLKKLAVGAVLLGLLGLLPAVLPSPAVAQYSYGFVSDPQFAGGVIATDDTDVAMLVRYVGIPGTGYTAATTTVEVGADLITFLLDGVGDPEITAAALAAGCPGAAGVIDIDDAQCNAIGEIVAVINAAAGWRAVPLDALATDQAYETGVSKRLLTQGATSAAGADGLALPWDTTVQLSVSRALVPPEARKMGYYLSGNANVLNRDPFERSRALFLKGNGTVTTAGDATFSLISVRDTYNEAGALTEVATTLYTEPGGATTVNDVFDLGPYGIPGPWGEKVIARLSATTSASVVTLSAPAFFFRR